MFSKSMIKSGIGVCTSVGLFLALSLPLANADEYSSSTSSTTTTTSVPSQQSYTLPSGTNISIAPIGNISTVQGDTFNGKVLSPVTVQGVTVIPADSKIQGQISSINSSSNMEDIQLNQISLPNGNTVPIQAHIALSTLNSNSQAGATTTTTKTGMPGPEKILVGTVGGAVIGGLTGTLLGVITPHIYNTGSKRITYHEGTGAVRGLAWGSAVGAGVGLVTGLVVAGVDRRSVSTTTTSSNNLNPGTNISTSSTDTIPNVYYFNANPNGATLNAILQDPVTITL